jgi:hypothetical protein
MTWVLAASARGAQKGRGGFAAFGEKRGGRDASSKMQKGSILAQKTGCGGIESQAAILFDDSRVVVWGCDVVLCLRELIFSQIGSNIA